MSAATAVEQNARKQARTSLGQLAIVFGRIHAVVDHLMAMVSTTLRRLASIMPFLRGLAVFIQKRNFHGQSSFPVLRSYATALWAVHR
jgi:hypothetical protein